MPTDFEEQVPAQEPQGSSKDEQAREHTNGHDQADAGTAGAVPDVVEISVFEKPGADGPLTKVGQLGPDGKPEMDPSHCWMSTGTVRVASFTTMTAGAALIGGLSPQQAIGIGVPKAAVPRGGVLKIVAKKLLNGGANVIARTKEHFDLRVEGSADGLRRRHEVADARSRRACLRRRQVLVGAGGAGAGALGRGAHPKSVVIGGTIGERDSVPVVGEPAHLRRRDGRHRHPPRHPRHA